MKSRVYGAGRFSAKNLEKMYELTISKTSLLSLEEKGSIPKAKRVMRGSSAYRAWSVADLPEIGRRLGYLKSPSSTKVVSVFSLKGGTGKTTIAFQLARTMALHGIRVVVVGLDAQESITQTLDRRSPANSQNGHQYGVFHILKGECSVLDCLETTDISSLSYIPETIELSVLDRLLKNSLRKEYLIKEKIVDKLIDSKRFDVVLFDCNPAWTDSVTGALASTDILISPFGCDINSYRAAEVFVDLMSDFQEEMRHRFTNFFMVPTLLENSKLSQNILARYRINYDKFCMTSSVRKAVVVQEANVLGLSLMETSLLSAVYSEFNDLIKEVVTSMSQKESTKSVRLNRDRSADKPASIEEGSL